MSAARTTLCTVLCLVAQAARGESKPPLVVFELEAKGVTPLQAEASTQSVVRGLRELDVFQVLSSDDVRQLLAIERTRQLIGTWDSKGNSGLNEFARELGAQHAVVGSVTQVGGRLTVEIRLLDTVKGTVVTQKTLDQVAGVDVIASQLPGLAQELMGPLLREQQGTLMVQSSESGAEVLVDDHLVGSTPLNKPLELPRGAHRLQVRKDGFVAQSRPIRIETGQTATESVLLMPSSDYAEAYRLRHGRLRVGAYIATAVAVGAIAGAIVLDRNVADPLYQQQFLPRQYALREQALPATLASNPVLLKTWLDCGQSPDACKTTAQGYQNQLQLDQILTIVLGGVGLAAAGTATYLWLTGEDPNRYSRLVAGLRLNLGSTPSVGFAFGF